MNRNTLRSLFICAFLGLACATRNPIDVAPAAPAASPAVAPSGSCFRGNIDDEHMSMGEAKLSSLSFRGFLSQKDVRRAVQQYMPMIKMCYQAANFRSSRLDGHLVTGMTVAADGTVRDSWISEHGVGDAGADAELQSCLGRVLCEVVFPQPKGEGGAVAHQAFRFGQGLITEACYVVPVSVSPPSRLAQTAGAGDSDGPVPGPNPPMGSLDTEDIRDIIRAHIPAVKLCYERELRRNLALQGTVSSRFTIAADGTVVTSGIMSSTMNNSKVEDCVGQEICTWEFPRPIGGGIVIVSYPFNFTHG